MHLKFQMKISLFIAIFFLSSSVLTSFPINVQDNGSYFSSFSQFIPTGVLNYTSVKITNNQTYATTDPYYQEVIVKSQLYFGAEAGNLQNVIWFAPGGPVIPSWIENGLSSESNDTTYWLKMPFSVGAGQNKTIFLGFESKNTNLFSKTGNEGYAPQLTSKYGEYDNGAVVFPNYWNFSTNKAKNRWNISGGQINSGLNLPPSSSGIALYNLSSGFIGTVQAYSYQLAGEASSFSYSAIGINGPKLGAVWSEIAPEFGTNNSMIYPAERGYRQFFTNYGEKAGKWDLVGSGTDSSYYYDSKLVFKSNFNLSVNSENSIILYPGSTYGTFISVKYVFTTTLLPNDTMPSVQFSAIQEPVNNYSFKPGNTINALAIILPAIVVGAIVAVAILLYARYMRIDRKEKKEEENEDLVDYFGNR